MLAYKSNSSSSFLSSFRKQLMNSRYLERTDTEVQILGSRVDYAVIYMKGFS